MVTDHTLAGNELSSIAQQEGIPVSADLSPQQQSEIVSLQQLTDPQFSSTYVNNQVTDHVQTLSLFIQETQSGQDPAVVSFAQDQIPVLTQHLEESLALQGALQGHTLSQSDLDAMVSKLVPSLTNTTTGSALTSMGGMDATTTPSGASGPVAMQDTTHVATIIGMPS